MGTCCPLAKRADDVYAVHVRQAEIENDEVRVSLGRCQESSLPGPSSDDVVLPSAKIDPQGP